MDERALGEVLRLTMGQSPPGATCNSIGDGTPLLNGPTEFGSRHPVPVQWTTDSRRLCNPNAVLLCVRGSTTGRTNRADREYAIGRGVAAIEADEPTDQSFAYYALLASLGSLLERTTGSVFPNLSRDDIASLSIPWPDRACRRQIAEVLGALDDKIEANEVVRRASRRLGLAIFEQALTNDCTRQPLGELVVSIARGVAPKYLDHGDGVRVLNQKCIRDGWISLSPARWMQDRELQASRMAYPSDILVNSTGVGTLGRVARWLGDGPIHVDGHVTVVRPNVERCHPAVLGYAMLTSQADIEALGEGSTGQTELSRDRLSGFSLASPCGSNVTFLGPILESLDASAQRRSDESDILIQVRDALLPSLLSGELRVRDAERLIEDAV